MDSVLGFSPFPLVAGVIGLLIVLYVLSKIFVNVGPKEIAIKERRYFGRKMPPGRVVATEGEVGIQADVLKPGLHLIRYPFEQVVSKVPLIEIGSDEMGVIEAIDGEPLPPGRIFAPDRAQNAHNNFQDPIAFIKEGGVKGIQMRSLPPGLWPIHPYLFRVSITKATTIPQGKVGIVNAADGASLDQGRLIGRSVEGHSNFQNAEQFIAANGQKGPQVDILTPGTYRILCNSISLEDNTVKPGLFSIQLADAAVINENQVGLVEALDGSPLNPRDYVALPVEGHGNFQNGNEFIKRGGQRGPQKDLLLPGTYYINPMLFKVIHDTAKEVKPGEVAVIVSNTGKDPGEEIRRAMAEKIRAKLEREEKEQLAAAAAHLDQLDGKNGDDLLEIQQELKLSDPADNRLDQGAHEAYVVPDGFRGIQETVVGPGRYYVNTLAVTPVVIPTTNQTVEWTAEQIKGSFDPFEVISKDGFTMQLEVRVVFRVKPEDAPFMVAKIGSIDRLIQNVMHPLIDSIFRNQASESSAMAYLQNRHEEQERAEARVRAHLLKYHVDVVNVLICHIRLPEELMKTQTEKVLAEQRQTMFNAQREAEVNRIELEKTKAHADNQKSLMEATVGVEISSRRAEQRRSEGEGEAHYILQTGKAEAEKVRLMGEAQGVAYKEQVNALGPQGVALVETLKVIGEKGVRITPDVLASGGGGEGGGNLGTLLLLNLFRDQMKLNGTKPEPANGTAKQW
ncbi:MAG TPA: SPFH domain-containing protein [Blastocatellia bacterium]|nr:SPFH domain-containing protein [Blastocatellia bacterium]HMV82595.1 SPFH domain-containing protein [Blastocatellia bacterium]HMX28854.1 SPFH domain-containing protein [Blastocatellia bacterium]HMZ18053.1 SPFH domain-containing protein [Blastocatellia bacterium]HNG34428.1 SPFH domain-containing protein [Blastocatellia bacterium]